jgi:hypothetical protein
MKDAKISHRSVLIAPLITLVTSLVWANLTTFGRVDSSGSIDLREQKQSRSPQDPCWFTTLKDKSIPYEVIKWIIKGLGSGVQKCNSHFTYK